GQPFEQGADHGAVAENDELTVGVPGERNIGARQNDRGSMIAAHAVECDASPVRHGSVSAGLEQAPEIRSWGFDARGRPYPLRRGRQDGCSAVLWHGSFSRLAAAETLFKRFQRGKGTLAGIP